MSRVSLEVVSDEQAAPSADSEAKATNCEMTTETSSSFPSHHKRYLFEKILGKGAFATVYRAVDQRNEKSVAIKVLDTGNKVDRQDAKQEVELNQRVQWSELAAASALPPIVDFFDSRNSSYLVFELLEGETLEAVLSKHGRKFSEGETKTIMRRLLTGIAALHRLRVSHGDIKPENVMFAQRGDFDSLRIIDLGFATDLSKRVWIHGDQGTPRYMAPELVRVFVNKGKVYGPKVDEWAAGIIFFRLLTGCLPFNGASFTEVFTNILDYKGRKLPHTERLADISADAKDLLHRLLCPVPLRRISAKDALRLHPFLSNSQEASKRLPSPFFSSYTTTTAALARCGDYMTGRLENLFHNLHQKQDTSGSRMKAGGQSCREQQQQQSAAFTFT
jgi:serine/threonine protein kinase